MREQLLKRCYEGAIEDVRKLLAEHPDLLREDRCSADALSAAIRGIDSAILGVLTPDVNEEVIRPIAAQGVLLVKLLLESGADPNGTTSDDMPPLHVAAQLPTVLIIKELLDAGADVERLDSVGESAIDVAGYDFVREYLENLSVRGRPDRG